MTLNVCYCGAQAGYPHAPTCPFPLFRGSDAEVERWSREAALLVEEREQEPYGGTPPTRYTYAPTEEQRRSDAARLAAMQQGSVPRDIAD